MRRVFLGLFVLFGLLKASEVSAHYLWLNVDDYTPTKGQTIQITLGWGHHFPETPTPPREALVKKISLFLITPEGQEIPLHISLKHGQPQPVRIKVSQEGIYFVVALAKHFVSKTTEGYFYKSREELKDKEILYTKWSETTAIAIISVGKPKELHFFRPLNSHFYLLPLVNPSALKEGDLLPVKVIFYDKPFRTWVYATYAGFSQMRDTFAWTTRAGKDGLARIKILKIGVWLIKSEVQKSYPDSRKADLAIYKCSVTFGF